MRGHPLAGDAWAVTRSSQTVFADQMFQGITREWIATDGREQRPIIVAAPFFQPVLQGLGGIPPKRRVTFLATFTQTADMCPGAEAALPAAQRGQLRCPQARLPGDPEQDVVSPTGRSGERRVGTGYCSTGQYRCSLYHYNKK